MFLRLAPTYSLQLISQSETASLNSASYDFWSQTYKKSFNQQQMTQELSILTGCSAGATESFVVCPLPIVNICLGGARLGRSNGSDSCALDLG
jgi:solute carrier family 25 2-oxodicarboxylate transporter 21